VGQKVNPIGLRVGINRTWDSRWYAGKSEYGSLLHEDIKIRADLMKQLKQAAVSHIVIERPHKKCRVTIHSARPGVVIGKKGEEIESLKAELRRIMGVQQVHVNIEEIRKPEVDAQLIADSITQQLEKRIMFRRAMKRAMQNAMRLGAQGIKIMSSGRLNGIEIARCEWYREGRVPLHTLKADIDYGFSEAKTTYGVIGCKVWVYRGDRLANGEAPVIPKTEGEDDRRGPRRPRPDDRGGRGAPRSNDRGGPRSDAPRADAGAPGAADATKPAVKRVMRKAAAPVVAPAATEGKGE
jgi:small subunit ribosomal protein S3